MVDLRETQWTSKLNLNSLKININDIGLVFYRKSSQTLLEDCHSNARITKTNTILKLSVKKLFAVENAYHDINQTDKAREKKFIL